MRKRPNLCGTIALVLGVMASGALDREALAEPALLASASRPASGIGLVLVGVRAGATFPQPFDNRLGTSFVVDVEGSFQLPVPKLERRLGIFLGAAYTQPGVTSTAHWDNVEANGGEVTRTLTQHDLSFALGGQWLQPIGAKLLVHGGVGVRMHLTRNVVTATAGDVDLGENAESSTRFGVTARLGVGYRLGPGALTFDLHLDYAPVAQLVSGESNTAAVSAQLGYVIFLL